MSVSTPVPAIPAAGRGWWRAAPGADATLPFWRREPGRAQWIVIALASLAAMLGAWAWATQANGPISPLFLPPPLDVWDAFVRLGSRPYLGSTLGRHVGASLQVVLAGWLLAGAVGLPL